MNNLSIEWHQFSDTNTLHAYDRNSNTGYSVFFSQGHRRIWATDAEGLSVCPSEQANNVDEAGYFASKWLESPLAADRIGVLSLSKRF